MKDLWIALAVLGGIALVVFATKLAIFLVEWKQGLDYIKMELNRSDGGERIHWEHEKRRHWRKICPFLKKVEGDDKRKKEQKSLYRAMTSGETTRYGSSHHSESHHSGSHHHSSGESSHHHGDESVHHSSGESSRHHTSESTSGGSGSSNHPHVTRHPKMK